MGDNGTGGRVDVGGRLRRLEMRVDVLDAKLARILELCPFLGEEDPDDQDDPEN